MPVGLVAMQWDERVGAEVIGHYPAEVELQDKTLMQIYSTHEYSGESGMISLMQGSLNIASYYTGAEQSLYVILLLTLDEDPDAYEEGLADITRQILMNKDPEQFKRVAPGLFQRLSVYPHLQEEQRICMIFDNQVKRNILKRLKDEGSVSKSELAVWMKDIYRESFVDIESALNPFIKMNLIKQVSVKGAAGDMVYLTADIMLNRTPPIKVLQNPAGAGLPQSLVNDYLMECKSFFEHYVPEENDTLKVIETILDPQVYEVLKLLRLAIVTRNVLEKLKKKGVDDVEGTLKKLWDANMLSVLRDDKSNEYYALKTDLFVKKVYPEYLVNQIRQDYMNKTKNVAVMVEHLNILEQNYDAIQREIKDSLKSKKAESAAVEES